MKKFIKYFYFSCTPFFEDLIWHLLSMVMQCFCSEKTLLIIVSFSMSENLCGWWEGVNVVRVCKPFIYLTFEKMDPFIYLII